MPKLNNWNATFWMILPYSKLAWTPFKVYAVVIQQKIKQNVSICQKTVKEEVIFYLHYYYRASRGIFTFLQFQPQEFTLLQDCMIKMNFSVYTKDDHFNWPLLHINFLSWNSFTNMMKNWHESLGADEFL